MRPVDYAVCLIMAIVMIVGGYQFYFFVQKHHARRPRQFNTRLDDLIPFWPSWVWIYSGLYYPIILMLVFAQPSYEAFSKTAFSFLVLLAMQFSVFFFFPVKIPDRWRAYDPSKSLSLRMLAVVHDFDKMVNSIPSMHVSVATLTAIHLHLAFAAQLGPFVGIVYGFPVLIALSALFTKQHYVYDILPGAGFGWLAWYLTKVLLAETA
jgi:membrane-associated phospholipid phosphatase